MEVSRWEFGNLILVGGIDLSISPTMEITFVDVLSLFIFSEWKTDTSKPILTLMEEEVAFDIRKRMHSEDGYHVFEIRPEDYDKVFHVIAKDITYASL